MYRKQNRKPIEIGKLPFAEECNPCVFFTPEIEISLCSWLKEPEAGCFEWSITDPNELGYDECHDKAEAIAERFLVNCADEYIGEYLMREKGYTEETMVRVGRKKMSLYDATDCPGEYNQDYVNRVVQIAFGSLGAYKKIHKKITRALEKKYKDVHKAFFGMLEDDCKAVRATINICPRFLHGGALQIRLGNTFLEHEFAHCPVDSSVY